LTKENITFDAGLGQPKLWSNVTDANETLYSSRERKTSVVSMKSLSIFTY